MSRLKKTIIAINTNPFFMIFVSICSIIGFFNSWLVESLVLHIINALFFCSFIIVLIVRFTKYKALKNKAYKEMYDLFEIIKKYNFQFKKSYEDIENEEVGTYRHLNNILQPISEHLSQLSQIVIGDKSCICIKMLEVASLMNEDSDNWQIVTLARSSSTNSRRVKNDDNPIPISKNSDFKIILKGDDPFYSTQFAVPSLPELIDRWEKANRNYENSTESYLDKYSSTIVIPIKTQTDLVSEALKREININTQSHYHIIGFLCWDSKNTYLNDRERFEELTELLESFACNLYPLLENYLMLLINKEKEKDENN